eukprot:CAMPEP_0117511760 /NCGR_PEP_ID=MMETSP0784-20121206/28676_1 /TAXON_ID=39447 /ORGANISM="" /LENGTH=201 /DNA_ID=CAMNT_0005307447 /DNA_START=141 /DNA_END=746 /DNA_ORIENTATION=+
MGQAAVCGCSESKIGPGQVDDERESNRQVFDGPATAGPAAMSPAHAAKLDPTVSLYNSTEDMGETLEPEQATTPAKEPFDASMAAKDAVEPAAEDAIEPAAKDAIEPVAEHTVETQVEFTFVNAGEGPKVVVFREKPIGLEFTKKTPLTVKKVKPGSFAAASGVEIGWVLTAVNGQDISSMATVVSMQLILVSCEVLAPAN